MMRFAPLRAIRWEIANASERGGAVRNVVDCECGDSSTCGLCFLPGGIMKSVRTRLLGPLLVLFILSACNLPDRAADSPGTSIAPVAVLMSGSDCWSGPGETFGVVTGLKAGQNAEIAGRSRDGSYLLVRDPANPAALCWLKAAVATVVGDLSGLPAYDASSAPTLVGVCPSPVGGGPTPVDCSAAVGSGCPSPVGGGPTPVDCSAAVGSGCPSPVGGGPTPVVCSGSGGPAPVYGCPSPVGGGPTPVICSASGGAAPVYGCPSPIGGGPTPVVCSGSGGPSVIYGCPSPIGGGPTPVDCSGSSAPPPPPPAIVPRIRATAVGAPTPVEGPTPVGGPTAVY
jgi:hypothetical protein